ncbi:MAG: hypothetical protein M3O82_03970, partial [Verrucomicrobiota bacterium]|nr:hypothetical protein [Verrucomicrobiota bacterium]
MVRNILAFSTTSLKSLLTGFCIAAVSAVHAADDSAMPRNLGGGLRQLAAWHAANAASLPQTRQSAVVQE